jgi:hypothetical protein
VIKLRDNDFLYIPLLLLAIYFSFFYNIDDIALFDLDEGAFSEATREMIASGNFLTTYLNGELRFDKPILIYWFQSLSVYFFGLNEFGVRFPSALFASLWAFGIYFFVRYFYDEKKAFWASFFMVMSLQISIIADAAIADALLNFFIAMSMFFIYLFYEKREKKYIYLTFLFIGLGTLTKGPVAIMVPFVVSFLFFALQKEFFLWVKTILNPIGIVIFLAITAPWYVMEYLDQGQKFIDGFFLKHNVSRFSDSMEQHNGNIFYFIPVLILGLMPFTAQIIKAFKIDSDFKKFMIIWFGFVFIFFSFSGTKLPHYVIYGYTGVLILMALSDLIRYKYMMVLPLILLSLLFLFPIVVEYITIKDKFFNLMISESGIYFDIAYRIGLFIAIFIIVGLSFIKLSENKKLLILGFIFIFTINANVLPTVANIKQQPIKNIALFVKNSPNLYNKNIKMDEINTPTFSFYLQKIVAKDGYKSGDLVFTKLSSKEKFKNDKLIKQDGAYALFEIK